MERIAHRSAMHGIADRELWRWRCGLLDLVERLYAAGLCGLPRFDLGQPLVECGVGPVERLVGLAQLADLGRQLSGQRHELFDSQVAAAAVATGHRETLAIAGNAERIDCMPQRRRWLQRRWRALQRRR
jgi:hypothetical protein